MYPVLTLYKTASGTYRMLIDGEVHPLLVGFNEPYQAFVKLKQIAKDRSIAALVHGYSCQVDDSIAKWLSLTEYLYLLTGNRYSAPNDSSQWSTPELLARLMNVGIEEIDEQRDLPVVRERLYKTGPFAAKLVEECTLGPDPNSADEKIIIDWLDNLTKEYNGLVTIQENVLVPAF